MVERSRPTAVAADEVHRREEEAVGKPTVDVSLSSEERWTETGRLWNTVDLEGEDEAEEAEKDEAGARGAAELDSRAC